MPEFFFLKKSKGSGTSLRFHERTPLVDSYSRLQVYLSLVGVHRQQISSHHDTGRYITSKLLQSWL